MREYAPDELEVETNTYTFSQFRINIQTSLAAQQKFGDIWPDIVGAC